MVRARCSGVRTRAYFGTMLVEHAEDSDDSIAKYYGDGHEDGRFVLAKVSRL